MFSCGVVLAAGQRCKQDHTLDEANESEAPAHGDLSRRENFEEALGEVCDPYLTQCGVSRFRESADFVPKNEETRQAASQVTFDF